jgi:hypothetical protein
VLRAKEGVAKEAVVEVVERTTIIAKMSRRQLLEMLHLHHQVVAVAVAEATRAGNVEAEEEVVVEEEEINHHE